MATVLAERYDLRAVVINPLVNAERLFTSALGQHRNPYTGVDFEITTSHVDELQQLTVDNVTRAENLLVLLQTGDETLDYRLAVDYYHGCQQIVEQGGNHRFQDYLQHLPTVMTFLALQG